MEAVLSYVILLVVLIGKTEHESLGGHCLVESSVEYYDLGNVCGDNAFAGSQRQSVSVVMYGSELTEIVDLVDNFISYEN